MMRRMDGLEGCERHHEELNWCSLRRVHPRDRSSSHITQSHSHSQRAKPKSHQPNTVLTSNFRPSTSSPIGSTVITLSLTAKRSSSHPSYSLDRGEGIEKAKRDIGMMNFHIGHLGVPKGFV